MPCLDQGSRAWALALASALLLAPLPRAAQASEPPDDSMKDQPELQRAMDAFHRGEEFYANAKYEEALEAFQEAASLYASPKFQYNIGACYEALGKYEEAVRSFQVYLRAMPDAPDRANVENRIKRLQAALESGEDPTATPAEPVPPEPGDEPADKPTEGRALIISGAVLTGVGAALALGGGIGFGIVAKDRSDQLDDVQNNGNPKRLSFAEAEDLEDEGKRMEVGQLVTIGVGAAIGITGVILLALGAKKRSAAKRAAFAPALGPNMAGFTIRGRF